MCGDDYLTVGKDLEEALRTQRIMESTLTDNGFILSESKRVGPVQAATFKGVLLNSVDMTQCVNPAAAELFKNSLAIYISIIENGQDLSWDVTRHVCGVLENWAQLCQEGRDRAASVWQYLKYGPDLWPACRHRLLEDLRWWLMKAELFAVGDAEGCFPLINGSTLADDPDAIMVSVTDYSGPDGIGGISGRLNDRNPRFFSIQHDDPLHGMSSFDGELSAFLQELRRDLNEMSSPDPRGVSSTTPVLVHLWVTDNEGAAYAINSGRCSEDSGRALMRQIFSIAAGLRRTLVAVWIPREENHVSDKLSHYAALLGVGRIEGVFSDLPDSITGPGA